MCDLKAKKNIDVRKFAYAIAVSRNLVFPASWKKTKCAGPDWLKSLLLRNSFIPHFLASKKNRAKPQLDVDCGYCCRSFSRDIAFDFCEACGLMICSFCRRNEISWCHFTDESLIENIFLSFWLSKNCPAVKFIVICEIQLFSTAFLRRKKTTLTLFVRHR